IAAGSTLPRAEPAAKARNRSPRPSPRQAAGGNRHAGRRAAARPAVPRRVDSPPHRPLRGVVPMLYTATIRDATVLSDFELAKVLDLLADIQSPAEDAVVWCGRRVVAVRLGSGRVIAVEAVPVAA